MLTRLKVSGFKNLIDVDVHFGPFTCIAGPNGVGKSNLFDAIQFLSALADRTLIDAALSVRGERSRAGDLLSLFHRVADEIAHEMSFMVEMIVPRQGHDDLGQTAVATSTFLSYELGLAYFRDNGATGLRVVREALNHITQQDAHNRLPFPHSYAQWRRNVVRSTRRAPHFISTEGSGQDCQIKIHQDGGGGLPRGLLARTLPRTVLSAATAAESPTAALAKREMRSWRLLQLEPSALREPDPFSAHPFLESSGRHLPAALNRLAHAAADQSTEDAVYAQVAGRLSQLIEDVGCVRVETDPVRELRTLILTDRNGTEHPAKDLSDGTLRFLALVVLSLDPLSQGLLCMEEPENGIQPARIPAMLRLLEQDLSADVHEESGEPLRQVIVNTHSPAVVAQVPEDSLLIAESKELVLGPKRVNRLALSCLSGTWRQRSGYSHVVASGKLGVYLNPIYSTPQSDSKRSRKVVERADLQPFLFEELK